MRGKILDAIRGSLVGGADSDFTGAIFGNIAGAWIGYEAMEEEEYVKMRRKK